MRRCSFWLYYARDLGNRKKMLPENTTKPLKPDETIPVPSKTGPVDIAHVARRRIARRLLPFLFVLSIIAFLDRMNVGAAAPQMPRDLGFTDRSTGLASGAYFL